MQHIIVGDAVTGNYVFHGGLGKNLHLHLKNANNESDQKKAEYSRGTVKHELIHDLIS